MKTKRCNLLWHEATTIVVGFLFCSMASAGCQAEAVEGADTAAVRLEIQLGHGNTISYEYDDFG